MVRSTQALYQRAERFGILGVDILGRKVFPTRRFDPDRAGLREAVVEALAIWRRAGVPPLTVLSWFTTPQPDLEGTPPSAHIMRDGTAPTPPT